MTKKENGKKRVNGIPLDGEAVARYRTAKALTQDALAALVGVDGKTIQRAEAGQPIRFHEELAEALGVPVLRLLKHSPEELQPPPSATTKERMRVSLIIDKPSPELVEAFRHEPLAFKLWLFCLLQGAIRDGAPNIKLDFSSIIVSADLTKADALRMTKAFLSGELTCLGVTSVGVQDAKSEQSHFHGRLLTSSIAFWEPPGSRKENWERLKAISGENFDENGQLESKCAATIAAFWPIFRKEAHFTPWGLTGSAPERRAKWQEIQSVFKYSINLPDIASAVRSEIYFFVSRIEQQPNSAAIIDALPISPEELIANLVLHKCWTTLARTTLRQLLS